MPRIIGIHSMPRTVSFCEPREALPLLFAYRVDTPKTYIIFMSEHAKSLSIGRYVAKLGTKSRGDDLNSMGFEMTVNLAEETRWARGMSTG